MPHELVISNGFFSEGSSNVTGSLTVTGGITGSLLGTASFATTASFAISSSRAVTSSFAVTSSYVLNAVSASWAGVASSSIITHNDSDESNFLIFTSNTGSTGLLTNTASTGIRYNPNTNTLSNYTNDYTVKHQGTINFTSTDLDSVYYPAFTDDALGGDQSIYIDGGGSYNYNPGTNTLAAGTFSGSRVTTTTVSASVVTSSVQIVGAAPMLMTSARITNQPPGQFTVYSLPTASYNMAVFEWTATSGSTIKSATYQAHRVGTTLQYGQYGPMTIGAGNNDISLMVAVTSSNFALTGSCTTSGWSIKAIIRGL